MRNVVSLTTRKKERKAEARKDAAQEFISQFYDWARDNRIDITTTEFKFNAATVLTVAQALLHGRD